jgi:cbb3-type cytochrome oxidase maturation protein
MSELLILIPLALLMGLAGLGAFLWAMRSGQFDDLDGAGSRILFDEARGQPSDSRKTDKPDK